MNCHHRSVSCVGIALGRYADRPFGVALHDRLFHLYLVGQTGTGKSTLLHNLALQDPPHGVGFCLIEPHGDLAQALSARLGHHPYILWDVADPLSPYGYNPLTFVAAKYRPLVAAGLIDTLKKQWPDAWGVRMEHLLRFAILALLEQPRADLRDIIRLFLEKEFRKEVLARVSDPQIQQFWTLEYPRMNYKTAIDGVAPIANKLGAFLAHPQVRKAVCEPETPLRFRRIMDEGQCLIVSLAKGRLGADAANVMGGLILSSIMHAAFSRQDAPESARRPFLLYVDEFHAFSTLAFANLMTEARKYGLGITLAHQHTQQMEPSVLDAVLGNVGSVIAFRVGVFDAPMLQRHFGDVTASDLINLPNYRVFAKIMIDGARSATFSAITTPPL